jgi:hypothetical protein
MLECHRIYALVIDDTPLFGHCAPHLLRKTTSRTTTIIRTTIPPPMYMASTPFLSEASVPAGSSAVRFSCDRGTLVRLQRSRTGLLDARDYLESSWTELVLPAVSTT